MDRRIKKVHKQVRDQRNDVHALLENEKIPKAFTISLF